MSNTRFYNELSNSPHAAWSPLAPGIDPDQWARVCRIIGQLKPADFQKIYRDGTQGQRRKLVRAIRHLVQDALSYDADVPATTPLVSYGPSGLGGPYQVEMRTIVKEEKQESRTHLDVLG